MGFRLSKLLMPLLLSLAIGQPGCKTKGTEAGKTGLGPSVKDPGPSLKMQTGVLEPQELPQQTIQADAQASVKGYFYIQAPLDPGWLNPRPLVWGLSILGPRHGLAAVTTDSLLLRLVGPEAPDQAVRVKIRTDQGSTPWDKKAQPSTRELVVELTGQSSPIEDLPNRFFRALGQTFSQEGRIWGQPSDPFSSFAAGRAAFISGQHRPSIAQMPQETRRSDLGEMMSLYTGMSSVQEALQTDRGLLVRPGYHGSDVPLADLKGISLAEHPWEKMIDDLPKGQKPTIEPLAAHVPADMLYSHFNDLRTFVKLTSELEELGTPLIQIFETHAGDYGIGQRYERELMVERLGLAEKLGHLAADGVAVVAGDPFLREGADVAVLFSLKDRKTLLAALEVYELRARKKHPDLKVSELSLAGTKVRLAQTESGQVRQYRAEKDGILILSNSRSCLNRILTVGQEGNQPLAKSGDFRYMRALYPYRNDGQVGFVFLPDAFVAKAVSPRKKILAARRMAIQADLMAINYATLLYGWLEGSAPGNKEQMIALGVLNNKDLQDSFGQTINFDLKNGAWSSRWGRPGAMTPLADLPLDKIGLDEKRAYERFRNTYQSYWRKYIDPVAAQISYREEGRLLDVDVRILPLIENSDYDELVERAGKKSIGPPRLNGAVQWTFAVGQNASLRRELSQLGRAFVPGQEAVLGWLGDWVMFGVLDHSGLWDLALALDAIPAVAGTKDDEYSALKKVGGQFPIYAGAQVKSKVALAALLTALKNQAENAAPGMVSWGQGKPHRSVPVVEIGPIDKKEIKLTVCYATVKDTFVIALGRPTIEALIDARLAGHMPQAQGDAQALMGVATLGPDSWLSKTILGLLEAGVRSANRLAFRNMETLSRGRIPMGKDPQSTRHKAMAYLGFEPVSPSGGHFSQSAPGQVSHSIYGSLERPVFPALPLAKSPATRVVRSVQSIDMSLSFDGQGDSRGLRAQLKLRRRPGI